MTTLRAGLLGLGRGGQQLAATMRRNSRCELVSVGSLQANRLEQFAAGHQGVTTYNDYRLAIVSRPLDVLFVAIPPFARLDYLRVAAERRIPTWMLSPPLHRYGQLLEVDELFERAEVPIAAARIWGGESALKPSALRLDTIGAPCLAEGCVRTGGLGDLGWRGDSTQAGGGVLIDRGYLLLDAIVQVMGTPDSVMAALGRSPRSGSRTLYDTEDVAAIVCHYAGGAIATLTACRIAGPEEWSLRLSAADGCLEVDREWVIVRDREGVAELRRHPRATDPLAEQIEDFIGALQTSSRTPTSRLREHAATMAVIQAAYLSARTGHPETPASILEMHRVR